MCFHKILKNYKNKKPMKTILVIAFMLMGVLASAQVQEVSDAISKQSCTYPFEKIVTMLAGYDKSNFFASADIQPEDCQTLWKAMLTEQLLDPSQWALQPGNVDVNIAQVGKNRLFVTIDKKGRKVFFHMEEYLPESTNKRFRLLGESSGISPN